MIDLLDQNVRKEFDDWVETRRKKTKEMIEKNKKKKRCCKWETVEK